MIWKGLFLVFLLAAAMQDIREKQVDVRIYLVFGVSALVLGVGRWLGQGEVYGVLEHAAGMVPGLLLLGAGRISRGGIGTGDGCFFLVSGLMLGFWENLALLCYSTLCCGVFCLGYFVWAKQKQGEHIGKRTVPFLPFAILPGIWLAVREMGCRII